MPEMDTLMRTEESRLFFAGQAARSVTLIGSTPTPPDNTPRLLVAGQFPEFFSEAKVYWPEARTFRFSYLPAYQANPDELASFRSHLATVDTVLISVANPANAMFAKSALDLGKKVVIVSVLSPAAVLPLVEKATVVVVYSFAKESYAAAMAVLAGTGTAEGRLPVAMSP